MDKPDFGLFSDGTRLFSFFGEGSRLTTPFEEGVPTGVASLDFFFLRPADRPSLPSLFLSFLETFVLIFGDLGVLMEAEEGEDGVALLGQMMLPESVSARQGARRE